jgi:hypothetical protein
MRTKQFALQKALTCLFFYLPFIASTLFSQNDEEKMEQVFTGVSPIILPKEGLEVSFTNSLASFWLAFKQYEPQFDAFRVANRYRFSRFEQLLRVSYGFDKDKRWDLGAELRFAHARLDDEARSSPFRAIGRHQTTTGETYRGPTQLGLRARFVPFGELPELTFQATASIPVIKSEELRQRLDAQRSQVGLLATYFQSFDDRASFLLQADWSSRIRNKENAATTHAASLGGYLVFDLFGGESWSLFPGVVYGATLQAYSGNLNRANQQMLGGLGLLYRSGEQLSVYFNGQTPFILESGSQYVEWVRPSFSALSVGIRYVL